MFLCTMGSKSVRLNAAAAAAIRVGEPHTKSLAAMEKKPFVRLELVYIYKRVFRGGTDGDSSTGQQSTLNTFRLCCDPPREQTIS